MQSIQLSCGTVHTLQQLEDAGLSYVPCGRVDGTDKPLLTYAQLWKDRRQVSRETYGRHWNAHALRHMNGVQLMTGKPTYRHTDRTGIYLYYTSLDIERRMIEEYPAEVDQIERLYRENLIGSPCRIRTKSDGLRLDAYTEYVGKKMSFKDDAGMLFEVLADKCLARIDNRYSMLEGSLLELPTLPKETLREIYHIAASVATVEQSDEKPREVVETSQLGDLDIEWGSDSRSQLFPTQHCQRTSHRSNRDEVRFTKHPDGSVDGKCFNCGETWWEVAPEHKSPSRRPKLQRADDAPSEPTETLQENRSHRETATDTFLTDTTEDNTLHILLVKDATGTGKTHTVFAKSKQHSKRTLVNPPHNELAAQAVEIAREQGYLNPFHLLGREHNWDDSGIADIPVEERTRDLFEKNNCIMVDQLKEYKDKRLAPRTYCEHKCPFREGCPHLAQYKGLAQRDFIASCTPNLLFDLNMRGYLQSLVTATEAPSDEDLAIDAMLGTNSDETKAFDFAILDDYGISGLYTDITFSESDFKAIKKAWSGTPTGEFAKLLLKAFEKKKPQKIVEALRSACEMTAEHHTYIAKSLTQHARIGTIEYAEYPKSSKETQRMLTEKVVRYTDGGTQFIPVDFDAYKELTEKGIPTVHPQHLQTTAVGEQVRVPHAPTHALIAGVPLSILTPVWQKGATPIELLDIFLKSIGNDKNAPINRMFRETGDPPNAVLTFSIPPQAPVGILPHIALLSATTDISDTKRAFDGQDSVTFSEHIGGQLEWADGVQVYQFQDARLTSASVFEYPKDADGKRKLQEAPTGLTKTAEKRLRKLNDWAKATDGLTAFISYKEFTEHFGEEVNGFDIVTHFDKVAGLNFDGLKYLVVFGYPKVKYEVVMEHARKQYAADSQPLSKGTYEELTETSEYQENGITITERRYKDPRLEKIRCQLATEKLQQAIGRARIPVWTDTQTILFTNAPIGNITKRATLFSSAALNLADTHSDLTDAMKRIKKAEESGDVHALMETKGVSQRQAYNDSKEVRDEKKADRYARILELEKQGLNASEIHRKTGVPRSTVIDVLKRSKRGDGNCSHQLVYTNYDVQNPSPPADVDAPCVESENTENSNGAHKPVPRGEYSKLPQREARAELQCCEGNYNYGGAAYLRTLFKRNGWEIDP